jgi:deoxyhypusine synthase
LGEFHLVGKELRAKGQNRIGNLLIPNDNYCAFEAWMQPILQKMHEEQNQAGKAWTPSKMIKRFGECINNESSVYYWCALTHMLQPL